MRCAVKSCVFIEIYSEFETFSTSSAPSGHLLLKEKALVCANLKQIDKSEFGHEKQGSAPQLLAVQSPVISVDYFFLALQTAMIRFLSMNSFTLFVNLNILHTVSQNEINQLIAGVIGL